MLSVLLLLMSIESLSLIIRLGKSFKLFHFFKTFFILSNKKSTL
jgi:hypothetical protein